jgi:hypothetical protein
VSAGQLVGPEGKMIHHLNVQVENIINRTDKQIGIFEIREHKQVNNHTHDDPEFLPALFPGPVNKVAKVVIRNGGENEKQEEQS